MGLFDFIDGVSKKEDAFLESDRVKKNAAIIGAIVAILGIMIGGVGGAIIVAPIVALLGYVLGADVAVFFFRLPVAIAFWAIIICVVVVIVKLWGVGRP